MPMIDVYAAEGTFADPHALAQGLATELMTIEQVPNIPMFRKNTAAFVHPLPGSALANVDGDSTYVRVQVLTNHGRSTAPSRSPSSRGSQRSWLTAAGDPSLADRDLGPADRGARWGLGTGGAREHE